MRGARQEPAGWLGTYAVAATTPILGQEAVLGAGCSSGSGIDQSTPESLAVDVVEAAHRCQEVTPHALMDHDSPRVCTSDTCGELTALRREQQVCEDMEDKLSAHVETANRDDSWSVMVYMTAPDNESDSCGFHESKQDGR